MQDIDPMIMKDMAKLRSAGEADQLLNSLKGDPKETEIKNTL